MSSDWLGTNNVPLRGEISVPGDKSISHRAMMLGAIAEGLTRVSGFLEGEDTRATAAILGKLGVRIEASGAGVRHVHGVGLHGLRGFAGDLDCGNAGTGMRLFAGLLSGQSFDSVLVGDESLSRRPMGRVIEPLARMGARIEARDGAFAPLRIHANKTLQAIEYKAKVPSAQVKSAILLAGLTARGETIVIEPQPTRDYTERMLSALGWPVQFAGGRVSLTGGHRLQGSDIEVPSDFSSAAFFLVAATLVPDSDLLVRGVGMNPRRTGLLSALRLMGADISEHGARLQGGEPVADLRIRSAALAGVDIPAGLVADMIDEIPVLLVAAACASGTTRITGAAELRVKESDRLAAMAGALSRLGVRVSETADGAIVEGGAIRSGEVDSLGDHRIAMSMAVASQMSTGTVRVRDCANVDTSFPGFLELARSCGFALAAA